MATNMLNELSPDKETWNIEVRVVRLWESLNYKMQDQVISLELIICDEEGTVMHAVANKMQVKRFCSKFQEGKAYRLSKFKVLMQASQYRPVTHVIKLQFLAFTKVEGIQCGTDRIPLHMFQFADSALIFERCNTTTFLTDILGMLTFISPLEPFVTRRDCHGNKMLYPCRGHKYRVTLWGKQAEMVSEVLVHKVEGHLVLALTLLLSKMYLRENILSSTNTTKVYLNPDIPERKQLLVRYKVEIVVVDKIGEMTLTLFDCEVKRLIRMSAVELLECMDGEKHKLPAQIESVVEKEMVFQVKITPYNRKYEWQYLTVSKIFLADEMLMCSGENGVSEGGSEYTLFPGGTIDGQNYVVKRGRLATHDDEPNPRQNHFDRMPEAILLQIICITVAGCDQSFGAIWQT
ncbi:hypothetical protein Tsubulata_008713 [Turnera subulata]|uniref:Replication protein A 70 kDa DNA-binding subunit B/D first OB fold domain-containing protein n=1 Tax=Turnera subulata TaxID=218843 RepID=A0A9Q0J7V0_9ROSI|nr:hypothetical protein Tsubulata_008713 [Turnera subulata]